MKSPVGGNDERPGLPIEALNGLLLLPHETVAVAAQDDYMRARPVAVALLVRADRELGHVSAHLISGQRELDVASACSALRIRQQLIAWHIGYEVRLPHHAREGAVAGEIVRLAGESVGKPVVAVEDELRIAKQVDRAGGTGHPNVADGFGT